MDISNAELQMPHNLLPSQEPAQENQAQTREGVPEGKEAGKHEQKNYESGHSEVSRHTANAVAVTLSKQKAAEQPEETEQAQPPVRADQELQIFDNKGRISGNQDPKVVDIVL